jgi:hypothetical protein
VSTGDTDDTLVLARGWEPGFAALLPVEPITQRYVNFDAATSAVWAAAVTSGPRFRGRSEVLVDPPQDVRQHDHRVGGDASLSSRRRRGVLHAVGEVADLVGDTADRLVVFVGEGVVDSAVDALLGLGDHQVYKRKSQRTSELHQRSSV